MGLYLREDYVSLEERVLIIIKVKQGEQRQYSLSGSGEYQQFKLAEFGKSVNQS